MTWENRHCLFCYQDAQVEYDAPKTEWHVKCPKCGEHLITREAVEDFVNNSAQENYPEKRGDSLTKDAALEISRKLAEEKRDKELPIVKSIDLAYIIDRKVFELSQLSPWVKN